MNSLKGASFPQISISVCKLCRGAVGSGRKRSELKSPELLEDHGSPAWLKACRLRRQLGPTSASTERQATCFHRLLRGSRSVGVSKVLINYYYFNRVGVYCSEERQGIVITGLFVYLMRDLHIIFVRCALFGLRRFCLSGFCLSGFCLGVSTLYLCLKVFARAFGSPTVVSTCP